MSLSAPDGFVVCCRASERVCERVGARVEIKLKYSVTFFGGGGFFLLFLPLLSETV